MPDHPLSIEMVMYGIDARRCDVLDACLNGVFDVLTHPYGKLEKLGFPYVNRLPLMPVRARSVRSVSFTPSFTRFE